MVGGPIGGFMSDKVHKSSAKHIRMGFIVCIVAMALFLMIPHEALGASGNWIIGAACTLASAPSCSPCVPCSSPPWTR